MFSNERDELHAAIHRSRGRIVIRDYFEGDLAKVKLSHLARRI